MMHQVAPDQGFYDGLSSDGYPVLLVHHTVTSKNGLRQQSLQRRLAPYEEEEEKRWEDSIHSLSQWSLVGLECHFDASSARPYPVPSPLSDSAPVKRKRGSEELVHGKDIKLPPATAFMSGARPSL
jgi:hypothetical protein